MEWGRRLQAPPLDLSATRKAVTASDLGAVDRALTKKVLDLNAVNSTIEAIQMDHDPLPTGKPMKSNRTGLGDLIATLRNDLDTARKDSIAAAGEMTNALNEVKSVASEVRQVADDMKTEAADARAALGIISNGAPV